MFSSSWEHSGMMGDGGKAWRECVMTEYLKEGAFEQQEHREAAGSCKHGGILGGHREGACCRHHGTTVE